MQNSGLSTIESQAPDLDWVRLLNIIQNQQQARYESRTYAPQRYRDLEEGASEDGSLSVSGSSPAAPSSPRGRPATPGGALSHDPGYLASPSDRPTRTSGSHYHQSRQHAPPARLGSSQSQGLSPFLRSLERRTPGSVSLGGPAEAAAADPDGATVSASAERHRLISESTGINAQVLVVWVAELVPFLLLLAWVFVFKHLGALSLLFLLFAFTLRANSDIRRLIALRREARPAACLAQAASVAACAAACVAVTLPDSSLVRVLTLRMAPTTSAVDALLLVLLADSVLRLGSLAPKLLVVAWFRSRLAAGAIGAGQGGAGWGWGACGGGGGSSSTAVAAPALGWGGWFAGGDSGTAASGSTTAATTGASTSAGASSIWHRVGAALSSAARAAAARAAAAAGEGSGAGGGGGAPSWSYMSGARQARQQSRVLTAVERAAALYRSVVPGPVWYSYLLYGGGFSPVLASLLCGFYLALKATYVAGHARMLGLALKTATRRGPLYGTYVGRGSGGAEGSGTLGSCPVCQDPVSCAVRLDCGHIFCEECILEWLERDRTCPMCRAEVRPAGLPSCSDGTTPLLPQVF